MKITFLGTAAATSCPLVSCRCAACQSARKRGGRDLRRRSGVLIDDDLLIDLGPDLMSAAFDFGVDTSRIRLLLQTHSHSDHFDAGHLITRLAQYAACDTLSMDICASRETLLHMSHRLSMEEDGATLMTGEWQKRLNVNVHPMRHGDTVSFGRRRITAVESNHDPADASMLWAVEEGNKAFLYATDTMRFTTSAIELLAARGFCFDAVAIDHTYGPGVTGGGHLSADEAAEEIARLRTANILRSACRVMATHISHEGMPPHDELSAFAAARGYEIAWDGMTVILR